MVSRDFQLGAKDCMEIFPFHLILDKHLFVQQIGKGMLKLVPTMTPGRHFREFMVEQNSSADLSSQEIMGRIRSTFHLRSRTDSAVKIRGGFYSLDNGYLLFVGNPVIHDTKDIARLSLKFGDVARHDPSLYYVAAVQAREVLLKDSRVLVNRLEDLVATRTQQLRDRAHELTLTESRLNEAQRIAKIGSYELDLVEDVTWWSEERYRMAGRAPETFKPSRESLLDTVHPRDRQRVRRSMRRALSTGGTFSIDFRTVLPDGSVRYTHTRGEVFFDKGHPVRVIGTTQDITERVELEREALTAAEHERNRIGRELHDGLGQALTGVSFRLQRLATELTQEGSAHSAVAANLTMIIQEAIAETRRIARDLVAGLFTDMGIDKALRLLADDINRHPDVNCMVHCSVGEDFQGDEVVAHLYRIAQESINNAIRHGSARNIELCVGRREGSIFLEVLDDGIGIPGDEDRIEGVGLKSMRYRARLLDGRLEIGPGSQGGTRVRAVIPD